ncbi:MAG: hypothetical protein AB7N90_10900, partial [Vicinamibacterales bacterium]
MRAFGRAAPAGRLRGDGGIERGEGGLQIGRDTVDGRVGACVVVGGEGRARFVLGGRGGGEGGA